MASHVARAGPATLIDSKSLAFPVVFGFGTTGAKTLNLKDYSGEHGGALLAPPHFEVT
jgi:hypothetical protein